MSYRIVSYRIISYRIVSCIVYGVVLCRIVSYSPVSTVVQCPLQPLCCCSLLYISYKHHQMTRKATASFTSHWIPLVWHCTGACRDREKEEYWVWDKTWRFLITNLPSSERCNCSCVRVETFLSIRSQTNKLKLSRSSREIRALKMHTRKSVSLCIPQTVSLSAQG